MIPLLQALFGGLLLLLAAGSAAALNFTVSGGQIFTPGMVVVDSPQPGTPLGGDFLHIALDVTANGRLPLPPYPEDNPSAIYSITIFLYSYTTGRNFTVTNGTWPLVNATGSRVPTGEIMLQEPGSTVKHVNWMWPDCLVGSGQPRTLGDVRGVYNISIRQNFRLNGETHYTIFDLPISVTNSISPSTSRLPCDVVRNAMWSPQQVNAAAANAEVGILFAPGDDTEVQTFEPGVNGLGDPRPPGRGGVGIGGAAGGPWSMWVAQAPYWIALLSLGGYVVL